MQKHFSSSTDGSKILPFLRLVAAPLRRGQSDQRSPFLPLAHQSSPVETRLAYPELVARREAATPRLPAPQIAPVAAFAHDARNALTSLTLITGLLAEPGVLQDTDAHYARDLQTVSDVLASLVTHLAEGQQVPTTTPLMRQRPRGAADSRQASRRSAGSAVEGCARLLKTIAGTRVAVHVSAESGLPPLVISENALLRVLMNLVKNASEAMPGGGTVRITARRALSQSEPAVLIHVSDDGSGIPQLALGRIFEIGFSTKQETVENRQCRGLGLAIVRELVEAAGGRIEVASRRGRGTTFELRIPCQPATEDKTRV